MKRKILNDARPPIDVVETQTHDLAAPQPQIGEAADDGVAAPARRTNNVKRSEELPHLVGGEGVGQ